MNSAYPNNQNHRQGPHNNGAKGWQGPPIFQLKSHSNKIEGGQEIDISVRHIRVNTHFDVAQPMRTIPCTDVLNNWPEVENVLLRSLDFFIFLEIE